MKKCYWVLGLIGAGQGVQLLLHYAVQNMTYMVQQFWTCLIGGAAVMVLLWGGMLLAFKFLCEEREADERTYWERAVEAKKEEPEKEEAQEDKPEEKKEAPKNDGPRVVIDMNGREITKDDFIESLKRVAAANE